VVHGFEAGRDLVRHPAIAAAGFTGSVAGGRALFDLAASRPDPIPFYGELGSLNPTVVTPGAVRTRADEIVAGFVGSYLLGSGQFCTKPGLLFLPAGHGLDDALAAAVAAASPGPLLNERVHEAYARGAGALARSAHVRSVVTSSTSDTAGFAAVPTLFAVSAPDFLAQQGALLEECFGPAAVIVEYASTQELLLSLSVVPGSLTTTVHADVTTEAELAATLLDLAAAGAGRVVFGGWPTGVAVTAAQHHGGPWPATTSALHTSVGTAAVRRWLRPVAYQGVPDALLPPALREDNPQRLPRRIS
jgi:NADP-dependent aldehyde dehydrogenase